MQVDGKHQVETTAAQIIRTKINKIIANGEDTDRARCVIMAVQLLRRRFRLYFTMTYFPQFCPFLFLYAVKVINSHVMAVLFETSSSWARRFHSAIIAIVITMTLGNDELSLRV